jgi:hypothetical protein
MKTNGHSEDMKSLKTNSTFCIEPSTIQTSSTDDVTPTPQARLDITKRPITLDFQE